jgi:hypothetical protein
MLLNGDVPAVRRKIYRRVCLTVFTIPIGEFTNEMRLIAPLGPLRRVASRYTLNIRSSIHLVLFPRDRLS